MTNPLIASSEEQLLSRAQLRPIFDHEGNLVDIAELKVETDRRLGIQAMRELFETHEAGDALLGADGWTGKQKRIINTPAPHACHYLRTSKKWDAATGNMKPSLTIMLPSEVVWALFVQLFDGQYSTTIESLESSSEEIMPSSESYKGQEADNMPGRRFYCRAQLRITIHLPNGQTRNYDGLGIAFGDVPLHKIGNISAINNAMRTAEKGAVSDAKREALSQIGRVFRRAFEDGDEMIEALEAKLLEKLRANNRPKLQAAMSAGKVAAPASRKVVPINATAKPGEAEKAATNPAETPSNENPEQEQTEATAGNTDQDAGEGAVPPELQAEAEQHAYAPAADTREAASAEEAEEQAAIAVAGDEGMVPGTEFIQMLDGTLFPASQDAVAETLLDIALGSCAGREDVDRLLEINATLIKANGVDTSELLELRDSLEPAAEVAEEPVSMADANDGAAAAATTQDEDGIPDFDLVEEGAAVTAKPVTDANAGTASEEPPAGAATAKAEAGDVIQELEKRDYRINPEGKSGKAILSIFLSFIAEARSEGDLDRMVEGNGPAIRKMTGKQLQAMTTAKSARAKAFAA